ncbi:MAG: DUF4097 family beta strand repeat protein [Ignavibacteriales bacterium]|nr:MAG: DUF4097 family beta strand repeat protein [Ignavibacteriales bacterium]
MKNLNSTFRLFFAITFLLTSTLFSACRIENSYAGDDNLRVLHEKTFPISAGKDLKLEAASGDVMILTWDKNEVYVKVLGNDKAEEKIDFRFIGNSDEVEIIAKKEGSVFNWFSSGIKLKFEIKVPASFNTKVSTAGGDIRLADVKGENNLKTSGGDVWVKNTNGNLNLSTSGGDINLDNNSGEMSVSTSGGDIMCKDFSGSLNASTSGGDIKLFSGNAKVSASTSGGDIAFEYNGKNNGIELTTSGGDITLKVPSDFSAAARLYTSGGDIECNLTTNNVKKISSTKFEADINNGGSPLVCKTSGGDIVVSKK